jgi:hypothetical protein
LFLLLLQAKKCDADFRKKKMDWFFRQEDKRVYVAIPRVAAEFKGKALEALKQMSLSPYQLISFTIEFHDVEHIGFLLQSDEPMIQKQFLECIEQSLDSSDLSISTTAKIGV